VCGFGFIKERHRGGRLVEKHNITPGGSRNSSLSNKLATGWSSRLDDDQKLEVERPGTDNKAYGAPRLHFSPGCSRSADWLPKTIQLTIVPLRWIEVDCHLKRK
jgi:hypothetical protein